MRIISQDGRIDFPYEITAINIWDKKDLKRDAFCVYAHSDSLNAKCVVIAVYSTEKKAQKAMKMLRLAYTGKYF